MCGLGKQAKNAEYQRLALEIVHFGVLRGSIDPLRRLGEASQFCQVTVAGIQPLREPAIDGIKKRRKRLRIRSCEHLTECV